jgi:YVTN family beta-propeller protein
MRTTTRVLVVLAAIGMAQLIQASVFGASLYVTLQNPGEVVAVDEATGNVTPVVTSGLTYPRGIAVDNSNGDFYVADYTNIANNTGSPDVLTIDHYSIGGSFLNSFAAGPALGYGGSLVVGSNGNVYVSAVTVNGSGGFTGGQIREYTPLGASVAQSLFDPTSLPFQLAFDTTGNLYASDPADSKILKFAPGLSSFSTFAPTSGWGLAVASNGNVFLGIPGGFGTNVYDSSGTLIGQPTPSVGGYEDVLASDGNLYSLYSGSIYRMNGATGQWQLPFSPINSTILGGAEWMAEFNPAPEPASLALLGLGGITLIGLARSRRLQRTTLG